MWLKKVPDAAGHSLASVSHLLSVALALTHRYQVAVYTLVFELLEPTLPHTFALWWVQSVCHSQWDPEAMFIKPHYAPRGGTN